MRILFSHSYRTGFITDKKGHQIEVMCYENAPNDDLLKADKLHYTSREMRVEDILKVISNNPPDIVFLNGAMDDECLEEVSIRGEIEKLGIKVFGHSEEATRICYNKKSTRDFLRDLNVLITPYAIMSAASFDGGYLASGVDGATD